jgi:hypothetical protein
MFLMLARLEIVADEPSPAPKLDRRAVYDERAINRACVRHWEVVRHWLADWKGRPTADVRRLNPANKPIDPNRGRPYGVPDVFPRLIEFRGPDHRPDTLGAWNSLGNGACGDSLLDLVIYLSGGCDRRVAGEFLRDLVNRIVEVPAA